MVTNHLSISVYLLSSFKSAQSSVGTAQCSLCKYIVSYLDAVLQNNKSEAAIEAALEKVCGILPASLKTQCVKFVDTYGPILAQLLAKYATPEQVCDALKVCNNGTQQAAMSVFDCLSLTNEFRLSYSLVQINPFSRRLSPMLVVQVRCELLRRRPPEQQVGSRESKLLWRKVCGILPASLKAQCTLNSSTRTVPFLLSC